MWNIFTSSPSVPELWCRTLARMLFLQNITQTFVIISRFLLGFGLKTHFWGQIDLWPLKSNPFASSPRGRWNQIWSNSLNTFLRYHVHKNGCNWDSNFSTKWGEWHLTSGAPGYTGLACYYRDWFQQIHTKCQRTEIQRQLTSSSICLAGPCRPLLILQLQLSFQCTS